MMASATDTHELCALLHLGYLTPYVIPDTGMDGDMITFYAYPHYCIPGC